MRFAIINNNIVENIIISESIDFVKSVFQDAQHIEPLDTPEEQKVTGPGWIWNKETNEFIRPNAAIMHTITSEAFKEKFNREEKIAILSSETSDFAIKVFIEDFWASNKTVDLSSQDLSDAIDDLIQKGFVKSERKEELLQQM